MKPKILVVGFILLASCAAHRPVFDPKFIGDNEVFERDLLECQAVARNGGVDPATGAVVVAGAGAAVGAGMGAAIGSIRGLAGRGAGLGAAVGGISGLLAGAAAAAQRERVIVTNCMTGRGYRPLY